jgi:hypothetical protein
MGLSGGAGGVGRWTNGCCGRASEEKQTFALDLGYIPGIQMTFPPVVLPAPLIIPPPKKRNICWALWNGGHQKPVARST